MTSTEPPSACPCGGLDAPAQATAIASAIAEHLLNDTRLLDAIADRIAAHMANLPTDDGPDRPADQDGSRDAEDEHLRHTDDAAELIEFVSADHPRLISGDPESWARSIVAASGSTNAAQVLRWALNPQCPTPVWRELTDPISPPRGRAGRGTNQRSRTSVWTQILAEYRATETRSDAAHLIDVVVSGIFAEVAHRKGRTPDQRTSVARRSALDILTKHQWDAAKVVRLVGWGMASRPHWFKTVNGVPARTTFEKIHGDYVSDTSPADILTAQESRIANHIVEGWRYHYARRTGATSITTSKVSLAHVADCIRGADGSGPIEEHTLKEFVMWLCQTNNQHIGFLVKGDNEFPDLAKVRRGLVLMTTPLSQGRSANRVATTNDAAAGAYAAAVPEV